MVVKVGIYREEVQAQEWLNRYPQLVGVSVNRNSERTNAIFGRETLVLLGELTYWSSLLDLSSRCGLIRFPSLQNQLKPCAGDYAAVEPAGDEVLVDAYCGIGTLTLPLAVCVGLEYNQRRWSKPS